MRWTKCCAIIGVTAVLIAAAVSARCEEDGFTPIFNGRDLSGWEGEPGYWSVEDGCLTGATSAEKPLARSSYIFWRGGKVADFELRATYRFTTPYGNSGINFRSQELPEWDLKGYQGDLTTGPTYTGVLFDVKRLKPGEPWACQVLSHQGEKVSIAEDGKRTVTVLTPKEELRKLIKPSDWNEYVIIAQGPETILKVNGAVFAHVIDREKGRGAAEGLIALQLHRGPPMKVQYKSILLKQLP